MKFKKLILAVSLASIMVLNTGCISPSKVEAGQEGVMTYQPWIFGSGGVDSEPIKTGLTWTVWSTTVNRYWMTPVKYTEKFVDLTAQDNVAIDFNAYITLQIQKGKSPLLHESSQEMWYENRLQDYARTLVRNEARTRSSIELRTNPVIIEEAQKQIKEKLIAYIKEIDLVVDVVKVVIGKVVPPDEVLKEAERTAAQKQRVQTQEARAKAELTRAQAETNKALADKAFAIEFNMTTDQFLRNKRLDIMQEAVASGDVSLIMNASDATPIFSVNDG